MNEPYTINREPYHLSHHLLTSVLKQNNKKVIVVFGGAGFIGHHLARRLKNEGNFVVCVDIKKYKEAAEYSKNHDEGDFFDSQLDYCHVYESLDLSNFQNVYASLYRWCPDEVYQLAADMGGAGYIFTGNHDSDIMTNSAMINLNTVKVLSWLYEYKHVKKPIKVFYSSSACIYPAFNQEDPNDPNCRESSAYPAQPDSEYGWEKLFSERLYLAYHRAGKINARVARYHNIFGPEGTWDGGKEKSPAAITRKVCESYDNGEIEIWGPGNQTRSYLYIDECVEATIQLINSDCIDVVNIGSEEMISINDLAKLVIKISGKLLSFKNIPGPIGVMGRNSNNDLVREKLGWDYKQSLEDGLRKLYPWIEAQVNKKKQLAN